MSHKCGAECFKDQASVCRKHFIELGQKLKASEARVALYCSTDDNFDLAVGLERKVAGLKAEVERKVWEGVETALEMLGFPEGSVEYAQVKKEWATRLSPDEETRCDVTCQGVQVGKSCNCKKDYSMGAYLEKTTKEDIEWIAGCDEPKPDSTDGGK